MTCSLTVFPWHYLSPLNLSITSTSAQESKQSQAYTNLKRKESDLEERGDYIWGYGVTNRRLQPVSAEQRVDCWCKKKNEGSVRSKQMRAVDPACWHILHRKREEEPGEED